MNRKYLTGVLLAASTLTLGTLGVVNAQDGAAPAAEEKHDHEHTPTTVHASDESAFELDNEDAYPDPDGFKSMGDRVSYAVGRELGSQIPMAKPDMNTQSFGEGIRKGLAEDNEDYALGYAQGFELARRFLDQRSEEVNLDAFIDGVAAAIREQDEDRGMGYLYGNSYREAELGIVADSYLDGVSEGIKSNTPAEAPAEGEEPAEKPKLKLSQAQVDETLQAFQAFMVAKQRQEAIDEGNAFFDGLKEADGWQRTESGIAYKIVKPGEGDSPDANDVVTMNYEGKLIDGTVFDSSYENGQPLVHPANRLIPGWTEMLQMMKPGAHFEVVIPYDLAYGEQGRPGIPPYSVLRFKMEMISFESVENAPAPAPGE